MTRGKAEMEQRMKYLCLVYQDETALDGACAEWAWPCTALTRSGQLLAAERLQPAPSAVSIRMHNGTRSMSDGPFAESKEQIAGYFLIDARDLNDAIRIAERIVPASASGIEVRPVLEQHAENFSVGVSIF
jgi:hypothetical protein